MTAPHRAVTAIAMGGSVAAVAMGVSALALRMARPVPIVANIFGLGEAGMVVFVILGIAWSTVGAILMVRRPRNQVGWVVLAVGAGYALSILGAVVTSMAVADGPAGARLAGIAGWVTAFGTLVGSGLFYLALIFPTGKGHTARWDRIGRLLMTVTILSSAALLTQPGALHLWPSIKNPFGIAPDVRPLFSGSLAPMILLGVSVLIPILGAALVSRYRAANAVERVQLRWFMASIVLTLVSLIVVGVVGVAGPGLFGELPLVVCGVVATSVPVAIGIAILRHHLYDIDRIISRSIGWATVSAVLVATFAVVVIGLQTALAAVTQGETLAVAASTLVAFALFQPVRRRVQQAVDRLFDRSHFDAERTTVDFAGRVRNEVDLATIRLALIGSVDGSVRPATAAVWLRAEAHR